MSTTRVRVRFTFDYLSPYAYLAFVRLRQLRDRSSGNLHVEFQPVLFAGLLNYWGTLGPAEVPGKRVFIFQDTFRFAKIHNIPFSVPKSHPFNPLVALRMSLKSVAGGDQEKVIAAIFSALWGHPSGIGIDLNEETITTALSAVLDSATVAAIKDRSKSNQAKDELRIATETAIRQGSFGIPTMFVSVADASTPEGVWPIDEVMLWGNDQLYVLEYYLRGGKDPMRDSNSTAFFSQVAQTKPTAQRRRPAEAGITASKL